MFVELAHYGLKLLYGYSSLMLMSESGFSSLLELAAYRVGMERAPSLCGQLGMVEGMTRVQLMVM